MNVLVLCPAPHNTSPGQRFRIEQWMPYLETEGFRFTLVPFEDAALHRVIYERGKTIPKVYHILKALFRRFGVLSSLPKYDLVYIVREGALLGPPVIERMIARKQVPIVYDFDDAVWVPYTSPANSFLSYLKCFGKTATLCRISSHVLAGNAYLAEYARRHNPHVTIVPTTIETATYQVRDFPAEKNGGPVTIGWTGSYSTVQHLDTIRPALTKLREQVAFRMAVIGTPSYQLDGVEVLAQPWKPDTEVVDLQQFDVGLMPLPDDDWSKGKCGLKLLQCMALGVPVVASPVGVNRDIIEDGVNGFLATTEAEWVEKLSRLIDDPALRQRMGLRGRQVVEDRYSALAWAPQVGAVLRAAAAKIR